VVTGGRRRDSQTSGGVVGEANANQATKTKSKDTQIRQKTNPEQVSHQTPALDDVKKWIFWDTIMHQADAAVIGLVGTGRVSHVKTNPARRTNSRVGTKTTTAGPLSNRLAYIPRRAT